MPGRSPRTDGDGWVRCARGHRHWGRYGAAGLLVVAGGADTDPAAVRVLLQHRSPHTHGGPSWSIPGGARNRDEDALAAALRETGEETTLDLSGVVPGASYVDDHGGWSYTTVLARAAGAGEVRPANWESTELRWWPAGEVVALHLHRGFAVAWPALTELLAGA